MARNTGPKTRISRRYNVFLGGSAKAFERKNYPPGMHGPKGSRRKVSEYSLALAEKQNTVTRWSEFDRGGHFAPMETPDIMIAELRAFFRDLR